MTGDGMQRRNVKARPRGFGGASLATCNLHRAMGAGSFPGHFLARKRHRRRRGDGERMGADVCAIASYTCPSAPRSGVVLLLRDSALV